MLKNPLSFLILVLLLSGCIIADEFLENKPNQKGNLEVKVKKAVVDYIIHAEPNYHYYGYGYSELIIHKPVELILLDSLKKTRTKTELINERIKEIETKIKEEKIKYSLQIDHFYQLKHKINKTIELFETRFYLNDLLKIEDTKPLVYLPVSKEEQIIFNDLFYETPIFKTSDYYQSQKISSDFYKFFKNELERKKTLEEKSMFLKHIIWVCQQVKEKGSFNIKEVLTTLTIKTIKDKNIYSNYIPVKFSELFETRKGDVLVNYYFFHKFIHLINHNEVVDGLCITFSPYYEISEIIPLQKPIDEYFNDKN